ncbi:MAG: VCBS repeat-containing protein, partial [Nanoarchaeota archaeon]|nr:VCBS repeat-containing protein [Nanoarchaeota archaeon]
MKKFILLLIFVCFIQTALAVEDYKPYLHNAVVPEHPEVKFYGKYSTELFPGAATYSYPLFFPKGTNGLTPGISLFYNSQQATQRPGILGAGWYMNQDYVYRDVNHTLDDTSDDKYILVLGGNNYELVWIGDSYRTEVNYYYKVENFTDYWVATKQDGTKFRLGYNTDSELESNTGRNYSIKWFIDEVKDTHNNTIVYNYEQDPYPDDSGAVYLKEIKYNNDQLRKIVFDYESYARPDRRRVYSQGNILEESRRMIGISVLYDNQLLKRYTVSYRLLNPSLSTIANIVLFGSDNSSELYDILFDYHLPSQNFTKNTSIWIAPQFSSASTDYGVRLVDVNNDGFVDLVRRDASINKVWINNKTNGWNENTSWTVPEVIISGTTDQGVRFADVNNDGFTDLVKAKAGTTKTVYVNNGTAWNSDTSLVFPLDIVDAGGVNQGVILADINGDGKIDVLRSKDGLDKKTYLNNGSGWTDATSSWDIPEYFFDGSGDTGLRLVDVNGDGLPDLIKGTSSAWLNNGKGWTGNSQWVSPIDFINSSRNDIGVRFVDINSDGLIDILKQDNEAYINNGSVWIQNNSWVSPDIFQDQYNIGRRIGDIDGDGAVDIVVSTDAASYSWVKDFSMPYLLKSIENEYGGITAINYTKSTQFDNTENGLSKIGFNLFVVSDVAADNSMDNDFFALGTSSYNYSLGKYDYEKSEFRGFGLTAEITPSSVVNHYFYQDNPRKGKEHKTEVFDLDNNLYSRSEMEWGYSFDSGVYNLSLLYAANYLYDGTNEPKITNTSYYNNRFGNYELVIDQGDVSVSGDEKYYNTTYAINPTSWIIDKVSVQKVFDADGNKLSETRYFYDNVGLNGVISKGELTKVEAWNDNGNNSISLFEYDDYGNVIRETDSLGNTAEYYYDADTHTYPEMTVNALGHIARFSYDPGTGNILYSEKNNIRTSYEYD